MNTTLSILIGFDGFVDSIYRVVQNRNDASHYTCMQRMKELSDRIVAAHGKSTNLELVLQEERLGGNGPILANALHTLGSQISLIGALGYPEIEPIFSSLAEACTTCISIAPSGKTDALEFVDGKLLLGKHSSILSIDEQVIVNKVGKDTFSKLLESCDIFASTNWTMLFGMTALWNYLDVEVLPKISKKPKWMFVDIADPAKRSDNDLIEAMNTLTHLQKQIKIVLGLNVAEAERVAQVMRCKPTAQDLCKTLQIEQVVIHAIEHADAATVDTTAHISGPHVEKTVITTGGGDNFNAGYILGLGLGLSLDETLKYAAHTSGYYVKFGKSPSLDALKSYMRQDQKNS